MTVTIPGFPPLGTLVGNRFELVEVVGHGGHGVIYRAVDKQSRPRKSYAVKCLSHAHTSGSLIRREIAMHHLASAHPGVLTLHCASKERQHTFLVMDYSSEGDLFSQVLQHCRYMGNEALIKHVFLQLIDAVEYCHSLGLYHRDLKPENILCFDEGSRIAVTDFGLATTEKSSKDFHTGSMYHMSPECFSGEFLGTGAYSPQASDVWSLAIILLNITTGRNPWTSASADDTTFRKYTKDPAAALTTILPISTELNFVLRGVLNLDWRERTSLPDLRRGIEALETFYADDVVFDGSIALFPWEVPKL